LFVFAMSESSNGIIPQMPERLLIPPAYLSLRIHPPVQVFHLILQCSN
jgi:hypothetical protein